MTGCGLQVAGVCYTVTCRPTISQAAAWQSLAVRQLCRGAPPWCATQGTVTGLVWAPQCNKGVMRRVLGADGAASSYTWKLAVKNERGHLVWAAQYTNCEKSRLMRPVLCGSNALRAGRGCGKAVR